MPDVEPGHAEHLAGTIIYDRDLITRAVISVLAYLFPIASIILLYRVENMDTRLGIITFLTSVFSVSLV